MNLAKEVSSPLTSIICTTGMHRSGTSLVASWLERCGLSIYHKRCYGAGPGNPSGHFEDLDFVHLQSSAIFMKNPQSRGWKIFPDSFLLFSNEQVAHALRLVTERKQAYHAWGWKDPRSTLFLENWKDIVPDLKVLLIWRPCHESAMSLVRRSKRANEAPFKVTLIESVKLWMCYNRRVCEYKEQHLDETLLFPLYSILKHDQYVLDLINRRFEATLKYSPLSDIFNPSLLQSTEQPLLLRLLSMYYGIPKIEKRLQDLSDIGASVHQS